MTAKRAPTGGLMMTACLLVLLAAPRCFAEEYYSDVFRASSSTQVQTMNARMLQRRTSRLQTQKNVEKVSVDTNADNVVRLGKKIIARRYSARRIRNNIDGTVVKVLDGSVIIVRIHGYGYLPLKEVRLLGVDAPEVLYGECHSEESKAALERLILGKTVELEKDDSFRLDSYRRALHFVRYGSRDVGEWMIVSGNAIIDSTQHSRVARYEDAQRFAIEEEQGLWSARCDAGTRDRLRIEE